MGVTIKVKNSEGAVHLFKTIEITQIKYVFIATTASSFELLKELRTEKDTKKFLEQNLIYEYNGNSHELFEKLSRDVAISEYITPSYVKKCFKQEKEAISLNQIGSLSYTP